MKQINQFEEAASVASEDYFLVQPSAGGLYKKVKKSTLLQGYPVADGIQPKLNETSTSVTVSVLSGSSVVSLINISSAFILTKCSVSSLGWRVRLYLNSSFAINDISRAIGGVLPSSHGLIYDAVFDGNLLLNVLPSAIAMSSDIEAITLTDLNNSARTVTVTLSYIPLI